MCPAKSARIVHLGDFTLSEGHILATDPCRGVVDGKGQVVFSSCARGLWHAFVEDDTAHTYKLIAISSKADSNFSEWTISLGDSVAVTTCQAGLFDKDKFALSDDFYNKICDMTVRATEDKSVCKKAGVEGWCFETGVVTGTATECDQYLCYTMTNAGRLNYWRRSIVLHIPR